MYLSQLLVNPGDHPDKPRPGLEWVKQTYRVHQRIWMAFPDTHRMQEDPFFLGTWTSAALAKPRRSESGFLFRIEPERPLRILVQSHEQPQWAYAFQNASHLLAKEPQVREYEPSFAVGQKFRFRLVMQMVTRKTIPTAVVTDGQKRRSEHPIRCLLPETDKPDPAFAAWRNRLHAAASQSGFAVPEDRRALLVQPVTNLFLKPTGVERPKPYYAAQFEGTLTCTDAEQLRLAVSNGIGRGKAFGMGLLSLASLP